MTSENSAVFHSLAFAVCSAMCITLKIQAYRTAAHEISVSIAVCNIIIIVIVMGFFR